MTPNELRRLCLQAEALRDRLAAELRDWGELCDQIVIIKQNAIERQEGIMSQIRSTDHFIENAKLALDCDDEGDSGQLAT